MELGKLGILRREAGSTRGVSASPPPPLPVVKAAGYDDAQLIEIVLHVTLNMWTNFINVVGDTEIDLPVVSTGKFN